MRILIANSIANSFGQSIKDSFPAGTMLSASIGRFASTEAFTEILENVQGQSVIVVQSIAAANDHTANDYAMQMLLTVQTLKRYGAAKVWAIMPFAAYARQDKSRGNHFDSIAAEDFAALLKAAGADGISTMEIHSGRALDRMKDQIGAAYVYNIDPVELLAAAIPHDNGEQIVVGGPDGSADVRAQKLAEILHAETFHTRKYRDEIRVSETELTQFEGQVAGRQVVMVDDMIDTGGTVMNCAGRAAAEGAADITVCTAHFIGSNHAMEKLLTARRANGDRLISKLIITDTIDQTAEIERLSRLLPDGRARIQVLPAGGAFATHIRNDLSRHPQLKP